LWSILAEIYLCHTVLVTKYRGWKRAWTGNSEPFRPPGLLARRHLRASAIAEAAAAAEAPPAATATGWKLRMLHAAATAKGAVCLDGSSPGYYLRPGVGADAKNFKIHFKGGGWCMTDESCLGRSKGWLGSSKQVHAIASFRAAVLTGISLCGVCSCQEI
jgi:hypothetical protein